MSICLFDCSKKVDCTKILQMEFTFQYVSIIIMRQLYNNIYYTMKRCIHVTCTFTRPMPNPRDPAVCLVFTQEATCY